MAMGRAHDRATTLLALPFGLLWGPALGLEGVVLASVLFLVGGLWLSPDLDTRSRAMARWGPLHLLWWPYRRLLRHRSLLSHSPLLGTGGRLAYLLTALALLRLLLEMGPWGSLSLAPPQAWPAIGLQLWHQHRPLVLCGLVALEASSWLHLLQDGDPLPRLPRVLRQWRPRGRRRRGGRLSG
jgi:uncharacterized metal-binding protein